MSRNMKWLALYLLAGCGPSRMTVNLDKLEAGKSAVIGTKLEPLDVYFVSELGESKCTSLPPPGMAREVDIIPLTNEGDAIRLDPRGLPGCAKLSVERAGKPGVVYSVLFRMGD